MAEIKSEIMLFGPMSSGKTTFIRAFFKNSKKIVQELLERDKQLIPECSVPEGVKIKEEKDDEFYFPPATNAAILETATLSRAYRVANKGGDDAHFWSAHKHSLTIWDDKGGLFTAPAHGWMNDVESIKNLGDEHWEVWNRIQTSAHGILVILDVEQIAHGLHSNPKVHTPSESQMQQSSETPAVVSSSEDEDVGESPDTTSNSGEAVTSSGEDDKTMVKREIDAMELSQEKYAAIVNMLCNKDMPKTIQLKYESKVRIKGRNEIRHFYVEFPRKIALCITKVERLRTNKSDIKRDTFDQMLSLHFGTKMVEAVKNLSEFFGADNIGKFIVSSVGYSGTSRKALKIPQQGPVKDWTGGYNVPQPFLWLLDQCEECVVNDIVGTRPWYLRRKVSRIPLYESK